MTYTFTGGTPTAVATQIGTGAYTQASLQSGALTLSIPSGTTNYSVAYVCPGLSGAASGVGGGERVIQASTLDGTSFSLFCLESSVANASNVTGLGTATVQVNAAAISGAANVSVGDGENSQPWSADTLSFSDEMVSGIHDVAIYATDSLLNVLAVRILRNQTIPGALNGGNPVVLGAGDETVPQTITYNNVPSGFSAPYTVAEFFTAGGAVVSLDAGFNFDFEPTSQYPAIPSGEVQSGDSYAFSASAYNTTASAETISVEKPQGSGGPQIFTFPAPWSYAGPTAAALPTFNFDYTGFAGMANVLQSAGIYWIQGALSFGSIDVTATTNYQDGATTISIPDLSGLTGFIAPAPTGTTISWNASINQGLSVDSAATSTTPSSVGNSGTYTEP